MSNIRIEVSAPCPDFNDQPCPMNVTDAAGLSTVISEYPRNNCLYDGDGKPITKQSEYITNNYKDKMCNYTFDIPESKLKEYEKHGYKPNYDGTFDIYDKDDVVGAVVDKIYDVDHEHTQKEPITQFERILIIIGIVLFSLLILVSGILIYKNIKGPNLENNIRGNVNSIRRKLGNNANIAEKNIVKLIKSAKK